MADDNKIGLKAIFESEEFHKAIEDYNSSIADSTSKTEEGADRMGSAWEGLSVIGGAAWAAVAAAVAGATAEIYLAIGAAEQSEDVMAALDFQIGKTGEDTGITKDQVLGLADSLSKITPFDDEVITQAITLGMRFDGVNKENIQPLLKSAADLSASTGRDLPSSMKELALAITDPAKAMRLLRDANITLSDSQQKQLKTWKDQGNTAAITNFILGEMDSKIGGLAETMGQTATGKMKIMETALGNLQEAFGGGFLDALKGAFDRITDFASDPRTLKFFTDLGTKLGDFAGNVVDNMPNIIDAIQGFVTWLQNNQPLIVGVLAVITTAMGVFAATSIAAFLATAEVSLPLIAVLAAIGVGAALLFRAWTEDWGGIREKLQAAYIQIKPVLDKIQAWLAVNVPVALKFLADMWQNVLLPAIQATIGWIADNVLPLLVNIILWLGTNVPAAIQTLSGFVNGTLLPALANAAGFIQENVMPTLNALGNLIGAAVSLAVRALASLWQTVLLPAMQKVSATIGSVLLPAMHGMADIISTKVMPVVKPFADFIKNTLTSAFTSLKGVIDQINAAINAMAAALNAIQLPEDLTPGSPTPFEVGLSGINAQLDRMARASLPAVQHQMTLLASSRDVPSAAAPITNSSVSNSSQVTRNYLIGAKFEVVNRGGLLDILGGF